MSMFGVVFPVQFYAVVWFIQYVMLLRSCGCALGVSSLHVVEVEIVLFRRICNSSTWTLFLGVSSVAKVPKIQEKKEEKREAGRKDLSSSFRLPSYSVRNPLGCNARALSWQ